ncbi:radical SAM protein [archaeon]|nr:radical SAM protein [archaeon]
MRNIEDTKANSSLIGTLPKGCRMCIRGEKSVLFLTGICKRDCFYCPLSEQRKGKDVMWINEKEVKKDSDIIDEIKRCESKGVGITGGEPLNDIKRFCRYVRFLKQEFGKDFHIHAYTSKTTLNKEEIEQIESSGLDALRFHIFSIEKLELEKRPDFMTAIEIPVMPEDEERLEKLIRDADSMVDYINLNELEFSDTNAEAMAKKGFILRDDEDFAVAGSIETGINILEYAAKNTKKISVHLCTASTKYDYQYWNRLKRRAKNIKESWETVTREGLIRKGVIIGQLGTINLHLPKNTFKKTGGRIETSVSNARKAAKAGIRSAIVLQMPTDDGFDFELTPLNSKGEEKE